MRQHLAQARIIGGMTSTDLASALGTLRETVRAHGTALHPALRRELGELTLGLLESLVDDLTHSEDPRLVLQGAELIEAHYRTILRAQLRLAAAAEATGAHTLSTEEYNRLKQRTTRWDQPAEHSPGRTAHKDTAAVLAAWLGLNFFETRNRVHDAHRVVARRTMAGTPASPRYEKLSALFLDPTRDPRPARDAARRLEKFEPEDQIATGTPLPPCAAGPDGIVLEEHAVRLLQHHDRVTASKRISELCTAYKQAHTETSTPEEYIRLVRTVGGSDIYELAAANENAEFLRSTLGHLDNPNTLLGKAARQTDGADPLASAPAAPAASRPDSAADPTVAVLGSPHDIPPTPAWLQTADPAPDWAIDPTEQSTGEPSTGSTNALGDAPPAPPPSSPAGAGPRELTALAAGESTAQRSNAEAAQPEGVPVAKRRFNAFMAMLRQRFTAQGSTTQIVPTINVYLPLAQLMDLATAHGITTHGVHLAPARLRQLLCEANIIPHVLGGQGQILDQGRARRTFTKVQRQSLLARDRGCIRPECTYPPELAEAHHWARGGWAGGCPTNVRDGVLLCPIDHDDYHAGKFEIVEVSGLPHVLEAAYLDPSQTPRRNKYWFGHNEAVPGESTAPPFPESGAPPAVPDTG